MQNTHLVSLSFQSNFFTHFFVEKRIFYFLKMKKLFGIFAIFCKKAK